jgi:hypothetical protein
MMIFPEEKEFTLNDFIDAIEKNGLKKIQGQYIKYDDTPIVPIAGCALGQAAINLGVDYASLDGRIDTISHRLRQMIVDLNDETELSLPEIAYAVRQHYTRTFLNRKVTNVRAHDYNKASI